MCTETYEAWLDIEEDREGANQRSFPTSASISQDGLLFIGGVSIPDLIGDSDVPYYILDGAHLRRACREYMLTLKEHYSGSFQIAYASKAWNCLAICAMVYQEGLAIDVMSAGELHTAISAGVPGSALYFHGNNKSDLELSLCLTHSVTIVVDNWHELQRINDLAKAKGRKVPILLRITPGIECHTHNYIKTGHIDNKFGFDPSEIHLLLDSLSTYSSVLAFGFHAHLGSQIFDLQSYRDLVDIMVSWMLLAHAKGYPMDTINLGGGLGVSYVTADDPPSIQAAVRTICDAVTTACSAASLPLLKIIIEPGRSIIGPAGITVYRVGSSKTVPGIRTYIGVNGGMSDNPRPITYQSKQKVILANRMTTPFRGLYTIAGKHCESGDILFTDVPLPQPRPGDYLTVLGTGAYNYSQSSNYNRVPRLGTYLIEEHKATLIIKAEDFKDLMRNDILPNELMSHPWTETNVSGTSLEPL